MGRRNRPNNNRMLRRMNPAGVPLPGAGIAPIPLPPGAIDPSQLCWDDYWYLVLLPVFGEGLAPFKDTGASAQMAINMCYSGMRKVFWYCINNNWPCCGEDHPGDVAFQRAELMAALVFESDVIDEASELLIAEVQASPAALAAECPLQLAGLLHRKPRPRKPIPPVPAPSPMRRRRGLRVA